MSSYSTVRPGMEGDNGHTSINQGYSNSAERMNDSYQPEPAPAPAPPTVMASNGGTRIPGMDEGMSGNNNEPNYSAPSNPQPAAFVSNGKPLVGFLVSVSRTDEAEYWVLRQGQNTIGSNPTNDIVLSESSVSGAHAVLAIHRNPNEGNKLNVGVIDRGSSNGTFVNKNYIGFNPYQCKNLDKITIGNYEMLLMLFDNLEHDMAKSECFQSTGGVAAAPAQPAQPQPQAGAYDYASRDSYPAPSADSTRY